MLSHREWPIIWEVTKGSLKNKAILVPLALILSFIAPWLIKLLLIIGGLYLCFEGIEKLESWFHKKRAKETINKVITNHDIYERQKIKAAIRTDFILSAEIVVLALNSVNHAPIVTQIITLIILSIFLTGVVYGSVALIVKMDDVGLWLKQKNKAKMISDLLIKGAPWLMRGLTCVGTLAMFLVGGGILVHSIAQLHHIFILVWPFLTNLIVGICAGFCVWSIIKGYVKCKKMIWKKS